MPLTHPAPDTLADARHRLGLIGSLLLRGIGGWSARDRAAGDLTLRTYRRVGRLLHRVHVLLALLAAGRRPRVRGPRSAPLAASPAVDRPRASSIRLPRRPGWLMAHDLAIRGAASQLRHWLADPAMVAVLAEVPQARRPLATLCRMLAIPPWPHPPDGPLPPPKPRKPRPRKPRVERPVEVWHHRSIETDDGLGSASRPWWLPPKRLR